jgi:hypothetical protein
MNPARLRSSDHAQAEFAHEAWEKLQRNVSAVFTEAGAPMRPTDAARQSGMTPRTVFRYLKRGGVFFGDKFLPLVRDRNGLISCRQLQMINALMVSFRRPGRRYGALPERRGIGRANEERRERRFCPASDAWRLQRVLSLIDNIRDTKALMAIKLFSSTKYWRAVRS